MPLHYMTGIHEVLTGDGWFAVLLLAPGEDLEVVGVPRHDPLRPDKVHTLVGRNVPVGDFPVSRRVQILELQQKRLHIRAPGRGRVLPHDVITLHGDVDYDVLRRQWLV